MGTQIDLPIQSIHEAQLLDETLELRIKELKARADMLNTTKDERIAGYTKVRELEVLRARLNGAA